MADVKNAKRVQATLLKIAAKSKAANRAEVTVGYEAKYALFVHENLEMKWKGRKRTGKRLDGGQRKGKYWDPQGKGQSQFLLTPFRLLSRTEIPKIIRTVFKKTGNLTLGLVLAGQRLQRESQKLVPVDSGNLKGSAFTKLKGS